MKKINLKNPIVQSIIVLLLVNVLSCSSSEEEFSQSAIEVAGEMDTSYNFTLFTPQVINPNLAGEVLLELRCKYDSDFILHSAWGKDIQLYDDGTRGDKIPNDQVFSCLLKAEFISSLVTPKVVHRPYVGLINLLEGGYINIIAQVWSNNIPLLVPEKITDNIQKTSHLVNVASDYIIAPRNLKFEIQKFYAHFPDDYDFIAIIYPGFNSNRHHIDVKLNVTGIGKTIMDLTHDYGSSGRLLGINVFPLSTFFDGADKGYQHELGHQWTNFLMNTPLQESIPHWPLSDLANGMMGFSPNGGQGGDFPFSLVEGNNNWLLKIKTEATTFNDLELYLMGLLPSDEVAPHFIFDDQTQVIGNNVILNGPVTTFTINDIITQFGQREPGYNNAPKKFKIATLIITNKLLSTEEMSFYDYFSARAELKLEVLSSDGNSKPFYLSTGGRGEISTTLD